MTDSDLLLKCGLQKADIIRQLLKEYPERTKAAYWQQLREVIKLNPLLDKSEYTNKEARQLINLVIARPKRGYNARLVEAFGETKSLEEWYFDPRCKVAISTLYGRIFQCNWDPEQAITTRSRRYDKDKFDIDKTAKSTYIKKDKERVTADRERCVSSGKQWLEYLKANDNSIVKANEMIRNEVLNKK
jgi:hypothetical protein